MSHLVKQRGTDTLESSRKERHSHRQVHQQGDTEMQKTGSSLFCTLWHTSHRPLPQLSNTRQVTTSQMAHIAESCASRKKTPGQHLWPSNWSSIKDGNSFIKYSANYAHPVRSKAPQLVVRVLLVKAYLVQQADQEPILLCVGPPLVCQVVHHVLFLWPPWLWPSELVCCWPGCYSASLLPILLVSARCKRSVEVAGWK